MYAEPNWGMDNIKRHKDCPFRTKLANCDAVGGFCTSVNETICEGIHKALNMAMEALQERPQGKWIRRSSVGNWECSLCGSEVDPSSYDYKAIQELPSVVPSRATGKWIRNDNSTYSCSFCQSWIPEEQHYYARFCLHCGARMEVEEE